MNGIQLNGKAHRMDEPVPGCLGRMVNFFDLASSKNRLLPDKPHYDGSSVSRSWSDVARLSSFAGNNIQDEVITEWSSLNKKAQGTPIKMLLALEMSKDMESKQNPPNVVARLMGLDALPQQQPGFADQRSHSECYTRNMQFEKSWQQEEHDSFPKKNDFEVHSLQEQSQCTGKYEMWYQSQRKNCKREKSPQKETCDEGATEKNLTLIRQKFMEAKNLAMDEKLRQTKEFQDALDVLSSNGELFLKVLQEPNSLLSHDLYVGQSIPLPHKTKRITVLKPSKMMADDKFLPPPRRNVKQAKNQVQVSLWDGHSGFSPTMSLSKDNVIPNQPTQIVVLKPSPANLNDSKMLPFSSPSSPHISHSESAFEEEEAEEAKVVATETTQQMRDNLAGHRRDETLLSSVLSNGCTGDESSFEKSENEFTAASLTDSEAMSSRCSWEYVKGYVSPVSSFSRASYSPESSVCREAKRRLSERWVMIASSGFSQEQSQIKKSSSTLGEMLALSEIKEPEICEEHDNRNHDKGARGSGDASLTPRSLLRSKSLPVSSTAHEDRLNNEVSNPSLRGGDASKDVIKTKALKSSFTGKVTSLFFSRNKKSKLVKSSKMLSNDESKVVIADTSGLLVPCGRASNDQCEAALSSGSRLHGGNIMRDLNDERQGQGIDSQRGGSCIAEPSKSGIQGENCEQPSPISVLDQPSEDDGSAFSRWSHGVQSSTDGKQMPHSLGSSNLIDKSPPIGSMVRIVRTLSWDEGSIETATPNPSNSPFPFPGAEDNEYEWRSLVHSLLTLAGLDEEGRPGKNFSGWHSLESLLDPSLRDKYMNLTAKEPLYEAQRRQLRSTRKLIFDCVNAALMNMTHVRQWIGSLEIEPAALADKVWEEAREWVSGSVRCPSEDGWEGGNLVEMEVVKEVMGKGWADEMKLEVDNIGLIIERKLLQQLVEEIVVERTVTN